MDFDDEPENVEQNQQQGQDQAPRGRGRPRTREVGERADPNAITLKTLGDEIKWLKRKKVDTDLLTAYGQMYEQKQRTDLKAKYANNPDIVTNNHGSLTLTNRGLRKIKTFVPSDNFRDRSKMRRFKNCFRLLHMTEQYVTEEYDRKDTQKKREKKLHMHRQKYRKIVRAQVRREYQISDDSDSESDGDVEEWMSNNEIVTTDIINDSDLPPAAKQSLISMQELFEKKILKWKTDSDDEEDQEATNATNGNGTGTGNEQQQQQQQEKTVEQMLEDDDDLALFEKAKTDYPVGTQIRIHWTDQPGVAIADQEIYNAQVTGYTRKNLRDGTSKLWVNIKYVDHARWNESIGRFSNQPPFTDFWRRLVLEEAEAENEDE